MGAVQRFCHRAMLIEKGHVVEIGQPERIARAYNELNFGGLEHRTPEARDMGSAPAELLDAWFETDDGKRVAAVHQGTPLRMAAEVRFHEAVESPVFGFAIRNDVGHTVFTTSTHWLGVQTGRYEAGETALVHVRFDNVLATVRHTLTAWVAGANAQDALDQRENVASLVVHGTRVTGALVDLPHSYEIERR
jgi:hypothetical protein